MSGPPAPGRPPKPGAAETRSPRGVPTPPDGLEVARILGISTREPTVRVLWNGSALGATFGRTRDRRGTAWVLDGDELRVAFHQLAVATADGPTELGCLMLSFEEALEAAGIG